MSCPNCGMPQYCDCDACRPHNPPGVKTYHSVIWRTDGIEIEGYACGYCGFAASCDWWLDYEMQMLYFLEAMKSVGIDIIK